MNPNVPSADYVQMSWVVDDLKQAIGVWRERTGVGPFFVIENIQPEAVKYRGQDNALVFHVALAQAGPIQIELIQQVSNGPSAYRDRFAQGEEGLHHLAVIVTDYDREVALYREQGCVPATEAIFGGTRFAYIDARKAPHGCMIEVMEDNPAIRGLFRTVADAAQDWDGTDPVRILG